ncbi:hypothetical protein BJ684DRAFT_20468 [Piptocephalis cylindrospora]|uniref:Uncharacterized protein n=1 Tax=Piptocephalis cylindrospora TaxID=1907219 RepID=A0A4P9Y2F4_9FUNG|nr:hypothetical protein BJ684DRAFT_20468 [Piptocephalis cylindrospora]|eukprot:RKP13017.1 hypothetical protein BJ684DRAFT_20468 [Piptocephalis cylindrospora]
MQGMGKGKRDTGIRLFLVLGEIPIEFDDAYRVRVSEAVWHCDGVYLLSLSSIPSKPEQHSLKLSQSMEAKWHELCQSGADIIRATTLEADPVQKGMVELKDILQQLKELLLQAYEQSDLSKVFTATKGSTVDPQKLLQEYDDALVVLTTIVHTLEVEATGVSSSHRILFASLWSINLPTVLPDT